MNLFTQLSGISVIAAVVITIGCSRSVSPDQTKDEPETVNERSTAAGPPAIIYKTKEDYFDKVPVMLSESRDQIVGYPSQRDVMIGDGFSYPTKLDNGFLLDNRGINEHTAFLSLTYEEYSLLKDELTPEFLFGKILESNPFIEIYRCGNKFQYRNLVTELNQKIKNNDFSDCRKLK